MNTSPGKFWIAVSLATALWAAANLPLWAAEPSKLTATSHGAADQVSGSLHVLDTGNGRWMVDCGAVLEKIFQTDKPSSPQTLPPGVESVKAVFLTHAHADHLGRLPLLVERGFHGRIYMTEATSALAVPMLHVLLHADRAAERHWSWSKERAARAENGGKKLWLHWRDCKYRTQITKDKLDEATCSGRELIERLAGQSPSIKAVPCDECARDETDAVLRLARVVKLNVPTEVATGVRVTFLDAGHIPGSASILFTVDFGEKKRRVLFSGDLGNGLSALHAPPHPAPKADAVFVEATYGAITRKASVAEQRDEFRRTIGEVIEKGGIAWIPCYSMDRTQKILYELHLAQREKLLPKQIPIYCPSPTAREVTKLYKKYRRGGWFRPAVAADAEAFAPKDVITTVPSPDKLPHPCIILSTSDLTLAPWMRKMLTKLLPEADTTFFLVGWQDPDTAGERLLRGATELELDGKSVEVHAKVESFSCFSGHADATEIDAWLADLPNEATIVLIHGDPDTLISRAEQLRGQGRQRVIIAKPGEPMEL